MIDEFGEDFLGSSNSYFAANRPVTLQKVMVFCAFHDGEVCGREEFAMAEKDQKTSYICGERSSRWALDSQ